MRGTCPALGTLALLLAACAGLPLACSAEPEEPTVNPVASSTPDQDAVPFFLRRWKLEDSDFAAPSSLPLPVGSDAEGWAAMQRGYRQHTQAEQRRKANPGHASEPHYQADYHFSWDVFTMNVPLWKEILADYAGKPDLHYLEIGISEGRATFWMLENILTHPDSRATGIDPFLVDGQEALLLSNIDLSGQPEKVRLLKGFSQDILPGLEPESFDLIYIDGSHLADDVLQDAVYSWRLLRPGGLIIHDDYMWRQRLPAELRPRQAIDAFVSANRNSVEVVHRGDQIVLRKLAGELPDFCWNRDPCSRIHDHYYAWTRKKLYRLGHPEAIALSDVERRTLEALLRARRFGAPARRVLERDITMLRSESPDAVERLTRQLGLDVSP